MTPLLYFIDSAGDAPAALARLLRHLDRALWAPAAVALGPGAAALPGIRELGVDVVTLEAGEEAGALGALQLALDARRTPRLLGGRRFEIVHARGGAAAGLLARLAAPRLGARALVDSFDGAPPERDAWRRRIDRWTANRVTHFVLPAATLEPALRERYPATGARCAVVADGVDLAEADDGLALGRDEARRRFGLRATDVAIAHTAAPDADGGALQLLAAFHALLQVHPTARLLVAHEGPARRSLEAAAAALRLGPFVRFLGAQPASWPLLRAADVFALPALRGGMPAALLEAMAAGLPSVATRAGAVPEMVADGREALLVPPGDTGALGRALADLAAAPARRREMGALARRRVEECFRIERTADALGRLYGELLAGTAGGG